MSDRRANFFLLVAGLCTVLVPLAQDAYRTLTAGVAVVYLLLALASYLDHRSRR
jgi:hypothetical protein